MKGLDIYNTKEGFKVVRLHYTADPSKATPEWLVEAERGFPGGRSGPIWRKEMEIDFTAYSGQLLCGNLLNKYGSKIIRYYKIEPHYYKYGSMDWGRNNPASFHTYIVGKNLHIHSAQEIYKRNISIPEFSVLIKKSPYYQELSWITADPSMWNKNQETMQGLRSLADLFRENGINLIKGKSRDDSLAVNELLDRWYELDINNAKFTISPQCKMQIWEFERLRYREITTASIEKLNQSEQLIQKDNHSWDDWKYFISTWLTEPELAMQETKPEPKSLAWYKLFSKRPKSRVGIKV